MGPQCREILMKNGKKSKVRITIVDLAGLKILTKSANVKIDYHLLVRMNDNKFKRRWIALNIMSSNLPV
jgi:hypothetical protein